MSSEVRLLGADMEEGEHRRVVCPTCGGGSTKERSLSLTKEDGNLLWHCFRANCSEKGGKGVGKSLIRISKGLPGPPIKDIGPLTDLSWSWEQWFRFKMQWEDKHFERARPKLTRDNRVAYPIYGPARQRKGYVARGYHGQKPKALTYLNPGMCKTSWYGIDQYPREHKLLIVEDIPSAIRGADYLTTVALQGTSLDVEARREMARFATRVYIALDADATVQALKMAKQLGIMFHFVAVLPLTKDIKDSSQDELDELLGGLQ